MFVANLNHIELYTMTTKGEQILYFCIFGVVAFAVHSVIVRNKL